MNCEDLIWALLRGSSGVVFFLQRVAINSGVHAENSLRGMKPLLILVTWHFREARQQGFGETFCFGFLMRGW